MKATTEQIAQELQALSGNVSAVARKLGISRQALYKRLRRHSKLQEALEEGRATLVGDAYEGLVKAVHEGKAWAILFVLKTLGKDEGFTERVEVVNEGHPLAYGDW
ncbi:MAG: hypothetical protein KatS3mg022_1292 [Armatimonadota bacterium]|nr:MAG: hypothetical protein KatS3mg022_1292 [Armatimonadota bacterium]